MTAQIECRKSHIANRQFLRGCIPNKSVYLHLYQDSHEDPLEGRLTRVECRLKNRDTVVLHLFKRKSVSQVFRKHSRVDGRQRFVLQCDRGAQDG